MKLIELQAMRTDTLFAALKAMDRFSVLERAKRRAEAEEAKVEARHQFDILAGIDEQIIGIAEESRH